ncbi:MAG: ion transporter [Acidobacteria bacterium]|nr:ion transporter [Acidobacteriota bacterium]MCY3971610.1 ion transporter [Acidobacteriota bacterium]
MNALRRIVWQNDTPAGRVFDSAVMAIILAGLVLDSVATVDDIAARLGTVLGTASTAITGIFVTEYILRVATAPKRWKYITSFYGVVDLAAILPTLLGLDLRSIRAVRLFRLLRVLKVTRSRAVQRLGHALLSVKEEAAIFVLTTGLLLYFAATGIYFFEHEAQPDVFGSIPGSLWWAVATLTTVGYGDTYPITAGGRIFTTLVLLCGMAIVAAPAGLVAAALTKTKET